jgi:hypothetical protein
MNSLGPRKLVLMIVIPAFIRDTRFVELCDCGSMYTTFEPLICLSGKQHGTREVGQVELFK